jgi:membrane-bound lytic murein transglycosylase MltF
LALLSLFRLSIAQHDISFLTMSASAPTSPVTSAFPHIQWDALGSLRLTAQETALLRMAETNPIDYTLADSRDASMYARVLLKLLAEAAAAGAGTGKTNFYYHLQRKSYHSILIFSSRFRSIR